MALTITWFETTDWTTATTPRTISVTGGVTGDLILVLYGGDQGASGVNVTAASVSTTGGSTSAWSEPQEDIVTAGSWVSSSWATLTADGTVTVSLARTQSTGQEWGGFALLAKGHNGIGASAKSNGSGESVNLPISAGSAVAGIILDWDNLTVVAFIPSGATEIERAATANMTNYAGFWTNQAAGTTAYGIGASASAHLGIIAVEILAAGGSPIEPIFVPQLASIRRGMLAPTPMLLARNVADNFGAPVVGGGSITFNATVSFTGSETIQTGKSVSGMVGFTGALNLLTRKALSATVSFTGSLATLAVHLYTQALNAILSFTSAQTIRTGKAISATISFTSSQTRSLRKTISATVSFTSSLTRNIRSSLAVATISFTGSLTRRTRKALAATVSFTGSMTSQAVHVFTQAFNATVGFTGGLTTLAVHHFTQALNATLSFTGSLTARRTVVKLVTATVGFTSSQARRTGKQFTAAASFTSTIARRIAARIVASLPFTAGFDKLGSGVYAPLTKPAGAVRRNAASAAAAENQAAATARPNEAEASP